MTGFEVKVLNIFNLKLKFQGCGPDSQRDSDLQLKVCKIIQSFYATCIALQPNIALQPKIRIIPQ